MENILLKLFVSSGNNGLDEEKLAWGDRISRGYDAIKDIVGMVWIYVALGIAVGAGAHGYIPEDYMAALMGKSVWQYIIFPYINNCGSFFT